MYICPGDRIRQLEALDFQETHPSEPTSSPPPVPTLLYRAEGRSGHAPAMTNPQALLLG